MNEGAPDRAAQHAALGEDLVALQRRIDALHARLAEGLVPEDDEALVALLAEREEKLVRWARVALAWRVAGGGVELVRPREPSQPALPPTIEEEDEDEDISFVDSLVLGPAWSHPSPEETLSVDVMQRAQRIVQRCGPPLPPPQGDGWFQEANAVHGALLSTESWPEFPKSIQHALTGGLAARLRRLQDDAPPEVRVVVQLQLKKDFARLGQFSQEHQPGWVAGLGRNNPPDYGSWGGDADAWWTTLTREVGAAVVDAELSSLNPEVALTDLAEVVDAGGDEGRVRRGAIRALNAGASPEDARLTRLLAGHVTALEGDKALKRLRKAVRLAEARTELEPPEPPDAALPDDWPLFEHTRGKRAMVVGGDPREAARQRLAEAFGFGAVSWERSQDIRAMQRLADRLRSGADVDLVLLLARFISHKVTDLLVPALREGGVSWAVVERGYGVGGVQRAIERYLGATE